MTPSIRTSRLLALAAALSAAPACSGDLVGPTTGTPLPNVAAIAPASRTRGVDPASSVTVRFSHPMSAETELRLWLHEGSIASAPVAGRWSWSSDRMSLTFTPDGMLRGGTRYVLHLAPSLTTSDGKPLDHGRCPRLGGERMAEGVAFSFTTA